ncbi:hypothetical protein Hanom_Chr12g01067191 [Helianthus anomalus]
MQNYYRAGGLTGSSLSIPTAYRVEVRLSTSYPPQTLPLLCYWWWDLLSMMMTLNICGREPGEVFVPKSAKEAEMEKMLKSMEGMPGAPGMKMYSREELMSGKGIDDEDADDEDDEEEQSIPSNLGKILREKESNSKKVDWKQKITKGIKNVGEATKKHATKMAFKLQKWWKTKKATFTQQKSKSAKVEL